MLNVAESVSEAQHRKLSVLIPAYNEEDRLAKTLEEYITYFQPILASKLEIIVVCNGCTDGTYHVAYKFSQQHPQVRVVSIPGKGKGYALKQGIKLAEGDIIGFTDADGSTKPMEMHKLMRVITQGYDGAIGSRWLPGSRILVRQPIGRRIASRGFNIIVRVLFWLPYTDTQCGAKVFKATSVRGYICDVKSLGFAFDVEMLWRMKLRGYQVKEIPISWANDSRSTLSIRRDVIGMAMEIAWARLG
jgi:glycosyltransferase involved in cell wall biosynthesis